MKEIHTIQKNILKNLLLNKELRFAKLNSDNFPNDQFNFHLKRLINLGIVAKRKDGPYYLTQEGKEYANRYDVDGKELKLERQAKLGVLVICRDENGKYLAQERLKEPFYGYLGFITGKIKWGEKIFEAAKRELKEEAGLKADFVLSGIEHKIDYSKNGKLLEDKYFYIIEGASVSGRFKKEFDSGRNYWLTKEEILKSPDLYDDVPKILEAIEKDELVFIERAYKVERY